MHRILLVDDDPTVRGVVRSMLEHRGFEVVEAGDGKQALRLATAEAFDLLITDVFMPEKDGLETIMELRRARPGLKIIAMSGGGVTEAELALCAASDFGALVVLVKPFTMEQLVVAVDSVFAGD